VRIIQRIPIQAELIQYHRLQIAEKEGHRLQADRITAP
jgi:hypothetical protein